MGQPGFIASLKRCRLYTRPQRMCIVLALSSTIATAAARADTLLHQQAPGRVFGIPSDTAYVDDFGQSSAALIADQFVLSGITDSLICEVRAFAFFGGTGVLDPGPPLAETIRIRFYADSLGLPGLLLHETVIHDPNRQWTGQFINIAAARKEYRYELDLRECFLPMPGVSYWLEVAQIGDPQSLLRWENSSTLGGFAERFPIDTPWRLSPNPRQMAYELWTPEPSTAALLALALAFRFDRNPHRGQPA